MDARALCAGPTYAVQPRSLVILVARSAGGPTAGGVSFELEADVSWPEGTAEDLGRRDLVRVARVVHERDYGDGEYICEEGRPGAALFIVRRGVVEVMRRGAGTQEGPLALLEPPASFEEAAAIGTGVTRWFSVRARGPVSLLALGKSDLDALIANFPALANRVLIRLAGIMAIRLQMLIDAENVRESGEHQEGGP